MRKRYKKAKKLAKIISAYLHGEENDCHKVVEKAYRIGRMLDEQIVRDGVMPTPFCHICPLTAEFVDGLSEKKGKLIRCHLSFLNKAESIYGTTAFHMDFNNGVAYFRTNVPGQWVRIKVTHYDFPAKPQ